MGEFNFDVGSTISHFRLEKKLGEGGMGAVYLAEDITLSRKIALKFMNRDMLTKLSDENLRRTIETRFIREAKSAAAINHPNLAQIYEANFDSDIWFIAMEYIDGYDLVGKLEKNERFTIEEVLDIAKQTVSGLMFAWDNYKIIHRDIKPHNIMVTHSGIVKIVDLGLAKPMANLDDDLPDVTCAGQAVGTPHYMAPEQAAGEKDIDHSVDIFALGSTLYEILTGQKAFSEKTAAMIYMSQISKQYTPIQELRNDIPDDLARLIEKMLEPTLEERVTDYAELLDLFNRINVSDIGDNDETMIAYDAQTMVNSVAKTIVDSAHSDEYSADHLIMDRYRVLRHIGRNKAGVVYICMDTQLKMECTVKSLYPDREFPGEDFPAIRANFQRLMRDTHQNLVQIRDLMQDETTGELFIVMESLKGLNLREYTHKQISKDGQVDLESCIDVLKNVAQAIDSVNVSLNSVHNDIKPESVYLTENNQVKLLDYGITLIGGTDTTSTGMTVVTKKEIPLESPDYLAPEKWSTTIPGSQSDQYSLAVIIYEMLGRKLPFWISNPDYEVTAENDEDAYKQRLALLKDDVQNKPVPELSMLSPSINKVLQKALSKEPMDRYPNSLMFVEELEKTESSKNMIPMIIGAVAAIVVICGIAFAVMSKGDKTETGTKVEVVDKPEDDGNGDKTIPPDNKKTTPGNLENEPENAEAEKRAAEKRAADKREAEKLAKGNSEFMKKQRRKKLADMADAFELRLDEVKENDVEVAALFKEDLAKVKELEKADKFVESLAAWEKIKDNLENYDNKLTEKLKEKAVAKKKQVEKYRKKVKQWEKLDNTIGNILMKYDVNFSSSNDLLEQKEFAKAEKKYEKCLGYLKSIETLVKTKLTAKKGKDFALAGVDLELKWVNTMSMWVGKYEVTNSQYRAFKPLHSSKKYQGLSMDRANQPVCEISYNDAAGYCIWLTDKAHSSGLVPETLEFRLPTKAEWQAAAACGDDRKFPWGKDWPAKFGNFGNQEIFPNDWKLEGYVDKFPVTCDVSKSGKNKWDIYGLSGNLWEWTSEEKDRKRAVYGGAWSSCSKGELAIKISGSNYANPQEKYDNIGFRVVLATAKED